MPCPGWAVKALMSMAFLWCSHTLLQTGSRVIVLLSGIGMWQKAAAA